VGVGSTAPYMHDGRATTLAEAILEHAANSNDGSEAGGARARYLGRTLSDKMALIAFLENLVLFKIEEEEQSLTGAAAALQSLTGVTAPPRQVVKIAPKGFRIRLFQ